MRPKNVFSHWHLISALALLAILIAGCSESTETIVVPSSTQPGATITPPTTAIASPAAATSPLVPAAPPASPLTTEQRQAFVLNMLTSNGGCELPCWWGITPGEATLPVLRDVFHGAFKNGFPRQDGTVLYEVNFDLPNSAGQRDYYINLEFVEQKGIIQAIEVSSQINAMTRPGNFARDWQHYSIDRVINRYGVPSRVQLQLIPPLEPQSLPAYALTLVYEENGFWIKYHGPATLSDSIIRVCPVFTEINYITMHLQSPELKQPVFRPDLDGYDRSLEEAVGMSLKAFYENFKDAGNPTCLEGAPTLP